jgi:DNA-binding transcriptional regulator YdaS (Cro superfamily)
MSSRFRRTIIQIGNALYGPRWQSKFAQMTGLSPAYVSMVSSGERETTPAIEMAIRDGLEKEITALEERKKLIRKLLDNYKFAK